MGVGTKTAAPSGKILGWILGAGLGVRLVYLFLSRESPFYEPLLLDPAYYHEWGKRIASGDFINPPVFYGLPLYPFFLGFLYKIFGGSFFVVKLVQVFLGIVTLFFIFKIGEKLFTKNIGLLAASLAAFYGPIFFNEQMLIPEALGLPLYAAGFYLACLFEETPTVKNAVYLGLDLGLAALTKANAILFILIYLAFFVFRKIRYGMKQVFPAFFCLVSFLLVLAPVAAHNRIYGKDTVLLTSHSGFNFYVGNNPKAEGVFSAPEGTGTNVEAQRETSKEIAEKQMGRNLKPSEVSRYWSDQAMDFIRKNPSDFARLCVKKMELFFDIREISDLDDFTFSKNFIGFLKFPWINFALLGPLFLLGAVVSFKKVKHGGLVALWVVSYLAGLAAFFVNARYRLPILSVFFPFAAFGLACLYEDFKKNEWGKILGMVLIFGLGVWLTRLGSGLVGEDPSVFYVNAGDVYLKKEDPQKAMAFYQEALKVNPQNAKASLAMGLALSGLDRADDAEKYYREAIRQDPTNSQSHNNLGLWYDRQGQPEEARRCFLKAIELKPSSFQAHNNLGMMYGKSGQNEKAREELEMAIQLNPRSARAITNLGLVLYRTGQKEKALKLWKKALEIDPDFELAKRAVRLYEGS